MIKKSCRRCYAAITNGGQPQTENMETTGASKEKRPGMTHIPESEVKIPPAIKRPMVVLVSMEEVLELLHQYPQWFRYNGLRNATGFIQGMKGVSVSPSLYKELMEDNK